MGKDFNVVDFSLQDEFVSTGSNFQFGKVFFQKIKFRVVNSVEINGINVSYTYSFLDHETSNKSLIFAGANYEKNNE